LPPLHELATCKPFIELGRVKCPQAEQPQPVHQTARQHVQRERDRRRVAGSESGQRHRVEAAEGPDGQIGDQEERPRGDHGTTDDSPERQCGTESDPHHGADAQVDRCRPDERIRAVDEHAEHEVAERHGHEGHGKGVYYVDHHADKKQIEALSEIVSGRAGGGPFQVYAGTLDELKGPKLAKIIFHPKGIESEVKIEGVAEAVLEPIRNPVTGEVHRAIIELPGGFEASRMDQASARKLEVNDEAMKFNYTGTYGSFQETTWQGP